MIIQIRPDKQKSNALIKMGKISLKRLNETDMVEYPSNSLVDLYDVIHKLMEAITIKEGIKMKGEGAHQELIDYISSKGIINEQIRTFLQQMRDLRNRISYEGFDVNKNYIILNHEKIDKIIEDLFETLNK